MIRIFLGGLLCVCVIATPMRLTAAEPDAISRIMEKVNASFADVKDYTCMLQRRDRVDGVLKEHSPVFFKFVSVAVKPEAALKYNRHTILEADIGHILAHFEENYEMARTDPEAAIMQEGEGMLDGRSTWRFKGVFPEGRNYYGHIVHIHIDKELYLPIKIKVYGWREELLEEYYYKDLKVNVGLSEDDFDIDNSRYLFKLGY